jgi:hypothetical protein
MRDFESEHALESVLRKLNREFESNFLRQPVSPFLSLGCVLLGKAIFPPKTREYPVLEWNLQPLRFGK